jgi:peptidoglycan/xylan/chitin deacetylase (PgdA/CDA1 family)
MRAATAAMAGTLATAAFHVGPAATWLPPLRPRRLAGRGAPGSIAVTFDDGPDPHGTPRVLDALERIGWPATFFVLGSQVRRDPGLVRDIAARGHEVGLHGDEHRYLIARPPGAAAGDLRRGLATVADALGTAPRLWRPPYGVLSGPALVAAHRLGLRPVLWSTWGRDWRAAATAASVLADVCRGGLSGATVLLHDSDLMSAPGSWETTVAALPLLAGQAERRGLTARRLGEHLAATAGR